MTIQRLVEDDKNAELEQLPIQDKNDLIGFFEEIFLLKGNGLLKKDVVFYMFGQYVLDCFENPVLAKQLDFNNQNYWSKFTQFYPEIKA